MNTSVIICTHNPRAEFLTRTLDALKCQTLARSDWELLVIDNASALPASKQFRIDWHPHGRILVENELGLTSARLRGISESTGDIIVFVDDDNLLEEHYLQRAVDIAAAFACLGAWGGNLIGEFETAPPKWSTPYLPMLALREVSEVRWSNIPDWSINACPAGAGMVVRRTVAEAYSQLCNSDPMRLELDRKGNSLSGCGDLDLAFTACDIGLGTGLFPQLVLTHIIPNERITEEYFLRLQEGNAFSACILDYVRRKEVPDFEIVCQNSKFSLTAMLRSFRDCVRKTPTDFRQRMHTAAANGRVTAVKVIRKLNVLSAVR